MFDIFEGDHAVFTESVRPKTTALKVALAMLQVGVEDLQRVRYMERKNRLDALMWFLGEDDHVLSFRNVCRVLNMDPVAVRNGIGKKHPHILDIGRFLKRFEEVKVVKLTTIRGRMHDAHPARVAYWDATETVPALRKKA